MFKTILRGFFDPAGTFILTDRLVYLDAKGREWDVPAGFHTDFASIPRALLSIVPQAGPNRPAAVLHDWLYATAPVSRKEADSLFLEAMKAAGVGWLKRRAMFLGVRVGGWVAWRNHRKGDRQ